MSYQDGGMAAPGELTAAVWTAVFVICHHLTSRGAARLSALYTLHIHQHTTTNHHTGTHTTTSNSLTQHLSGAAKKKRKRQLIYSVWNLSGLTVRRTCLQTIMAIRKPVLVTPTTSIDETLAHARTAVEEEGWKESQTETWVRTLKATV